MTTSLMPSHLAPSTPAPQPSSRTRQPRPSPNGPTSSPAHSVQSSFGSPRSSSPRSNGHGNVDVDALLRSHGGDIRKALETVAADRNGLQAQNSQLWKLIERQRAQTSSLIAENDRLRSEREVANAKLSAAGLEPVPVRKMSTSSSNAGLGFKLDPPVIRRHYSDREDKPGSTLQVPGSGSSTQSSPISASGSTFSSPVAPSSTTPVMDQPRKLLPSPVVVHDPKGRRESRMAFPPEVSRYMSLAESPREAKHQISSSSPLPTQIASPNPPVSGTLASPLPDGAIEAGPSVPPPSSRALAITTETLHEEPEEEADLRRPDTVLSSDSVPPRKGSLTKEMSMKEFFNASNSEESVSPAERRFSEDQETPRQSTETRPAINPNSVQMNSALLPHTRLTISNSTIFPNAYGRDVLCFIVSINIRPPNAQPVTWNVAKLFSAFLDLDSKVRAKSGRSRKEFKTMIAPLPDGKAWKDFAPSKIDQRKTALESYIQSLLVAPLSDKSDFCDFLNTDRVIAKQSSGKKEGYLTKKGKNFGGWKTRYFVVEGPVMEYYESRGGAHLGSIVIHGAQIGRQNRPSESSDEKDYRHAFLIIEQVKKGGLRHVLCAESDIERDDWIEVLCKHVEPDSAPSSQASTPTLMPAAVTLAIPRGRKSSKDVVVTAAQPMSSLSTSDSKFGGAPSPSLINQMESKRSTQQLAPSASVPSLASIATNSSTLSQADSALGSSKNPMGMSSSRSSDLSTLSAPSQPTPRATKRQSAMPNRPSHSAAYLTKLASEGLGRQIIDPREKDRERKAKSGRFWPSFGKTSEKVTRPVFGVPLADSIAVASKANLPAVVFRCIEWLEAKHAETEEGIYRLSGSSAVMKGLRDRFDAEGDVDLMRVNENWDPHAVGGLLKAFLRELPHSLLTHDLHPRFLAVMDLIEPEARVAELTRLISELPPPNYALLRALTAHLILIVHNSAVNKMTLRNIGIVFSPTLGIPAGIFSDLVTHFGALFDDNPQLVDAVRTSESRELETLDEEEEETVRMKRNSMLYQAGGADTLLGLGGRSLDPAIEDSSSEGDADEIEAESEAQSLASDDNISAGNTPRADASGTSVARQMRAGMNGEEAESAGSPIKSGRGAGTDMGMSSST